jgi:hypothetical protein
MLERIEQSTGRRLTEVLVDSGSVTGIDLALCAQSVGNPVRPLASQRRACGQDDPAFPQGTMPVAARAGDLSVSSRSCTAHPAVTRIDH